MIDGLWTGEWQSNVSNIANHAAGAFILEAGKIYGGNTRYYYFGKYQVKGEEIIGNLDFFHFSGDPIGILGYAEQGSINFSGEITPSVINVTMKMTESSLVRMTGVMTKRMNLEGDLNSSLKMLSEDLPKK